MECPVLCYVSPTVKQNIKWSVILKNTAFTAGNDIKFSVFVQCHSFKEHLQLVLNQLPSQQVGKWSRRRPAFIRLLGKARAWAPILGKFHTLSAWSKWGLFEPIHTWNLKVTVQCFDNLCDQVQKIIFKQQSEQSCHSNRFYGSRGAWQLFGRRKTSTYPDKMFKSQNTFMRTKKNFHQVSSLLKRPLVFCSIISGWRFLAGFHLFLPLCQVSVLSCGILP